MLITVNLVSVFDSYLKGKEHLNSLGIEYGVYIVVSILLCIVAIFSRNRILHGSIAVLYSLFQISYSIKALDTMTG